MSIVGILHVATPHRLKHPADDLCAPGGYHNMNVIGHPHVGMYRQTMGISGLNQCVAEELVVRIKRKRQLATVASLNYLLRLFGNND